MRLVLLADGIVGKKIAKFLIERYPDDLALVVTTKKNEIYCEAEKKKVPVCIFDSEKEILIRINGRVDLGVLAWWPNILTKLLLDAPRNGFVNTHPSLLPYNRGKHYNFWALVEQTPFGVTLHRADTKVDTGDIIAQKTIDYDWTDTGETLYNKAQSAMLDLFCKTYLLLRKGQFKSIPQNLKKGSFHLASELEPASEINLNKRYSANELLNLLRARTFKGHPGCWLESNGIRHEVTVKIKKKLIK